MSWLYVPVSADSISESNSQIQQPDAFVMLRGKPTQPQSLSNAWKKKPWMKHLSGLTLEPSTANLGVEKWIASLEDTHASRGRRLVSNSENKTHATCGLTLDVSLKKSNQPDVSLKTSRNIYDWAFNKSMMTYEKWVSELRQACSLRQKSGHHKNGNGCLFWPTIRIGGSNRNSRAAITNRKNHPKGKSDLGLEQALEAAAGMLPMELESVAELPPKWRPLFSRPVLTITKVGEKRPMLNHSFAEWMMNLPIGWTGLERAETPLSLWWQRMRGEFLKIVSRFEQAV